MSKDDSVVHFIAQRETNSKVGRKLQKRLHVTTSLVDRLGLEKELEGHTGCVNCLEWDTKGRILASASDDFRVMIWDPFTHKRLHTILTGHHGNIFSVKFMPETNENTIVTCAGDSEVRVHDVVCKEVVRVCVCHDGRVKRLATAPDVTDVFWSAAEDGTVRQFDLRAPHVCLRHEKNVLVDLRVTAGVDAEAKCIAINPVRSELMAVGANDAYVRVYDRRMIKLGPDGPHSLYPPYSEDNLPPGCVQYFVPGHLHSGPQATEYSATYVTFGPNGKDLLVNLGSEQIYLFDITKTDKSLLIRNGNDHSEVSEPLRSYCNGFHPGKEAFSTKLKQQLPERINHLKLTGNILFEKEKYSRSIRIYNEAISEYPNSSVFYSNRAAAYMKRDWRGDTYGALRDCVTAVNLDPSNVKAFFRMSRCLFGLSWYEEAVASLNNFKKRFPSHAKTIACQALERDITRQLNSSDASEKETNGYCNQWGDAVGGDVDLRKSARDYLQRFYGHCNTTTDIKEANFFGSDGQFIVAGSDDGYIFFWDRKTTNNIRILKGDLSIVNCVQPHPFYCLLATSGIEHVVKLWNPRPQDGRENNLEVKEKDEVALTNQRRMKSDPLDVVLMSLGLPPRYHDDADPTYHCRTS